MKTNLIKWGTPIAGAGIGYFIGHKIGKKQGGKKPLIFGLVGAAALGALGYWAGDKLSNIPSESSISNFGGIVSDLTNKYKSNKYFLTMNYKAKYDKNYFGSSPYETYQTHLFQKGEMVTGIPTQLNGIDGIRVWFDVFLLTTVDEANRRKKTSMPYFIPYAVLAQSKN